MEKHIAKLFDHLVGIAFLDCLYELVALLQEHAG